jgi:DNA repair protein RadA/Sms
MKCGSCGALSARWTGRCQSCGEWNSLVEQPRPPAGSSRLPFGKDERSGRSELTDLGTLGAAGATVPLSSVDPRESAPRTTGVSELDRVLGGGFVPGSLTLLAGEPGVGKSTLLLQSLRTKAQAGEPVLLVSAEESAQQVRLRAERLGPIPERLYVLASTDAFEVIDAVSSTGAELVVVDSVQAVALRDVSGPPGSLAQVRACAELLSGLAQAHGASVVLVGHVTKQGTLAGPRSLEHLVDTVLTVEGDRHHALRMVRAVKHRFGPSGELGLFEMGERGLAEVSDPYRMLLGDRSPGAPGSSVLPTVEGERAIVVELQALVSPVRSASPRRAARGVETGRVGMLLAILEQHCGIRLARSDVFCSVAGGMRVTEPGADLPLAVAIVSAASGLPVPADLVAFGEVGLAGEVRQVPHSPRRLLEAQRLGFRHALVPSSTPGCPPGMELIKVDTLGAAVRLATGSGN